MNRRTLLIAGATGTAAVTIAAIAVAGTREPAPPLPGSGLVVVDTPTTPLNPRRTPATDTAAAAVRWEPGPWGEVVIAGHRLLLPASATDGPLRDRGDGWSSDYPATALGAAIAVLRGPWLVFAAPAPLRAEVAATVLTRAAAADPGPVNPRLGWALPPDVLAGFAALDLRTLGVTTTLTSPTKATAHVFLQRADPAGTTLIRTTHHLVHAGGQWLIDADYSDATGQPITTDQLPARYTLAVPDDQE